MKKLYVLICAFFCSLYFSNEVNAQWVFIGSTNTPGPPYNLLYYKLISVNNPADRYASVIELSVQGDANYFQMQALYQIRVDKYEGTPDRFDGMEIKCISGNPGAANFYVYNNALWVKSNCQWGGLYYQKAAEFNSTVISSTITSGETEPTGFLKATNSYGLKCDFDNNNFYELPYFGFAGESNFAGPITIKSDLSNSQTRPAVTNGTIKGEIRGSSGESPLMDDGFLRLSAGGGTNYWVKSFIDLSGYTDNVSSDRYQNIILGTSGSERMRIDAMGNVVIGTTNSQGYKLSVNGAMRTKKVVVTQTGWPDYVFDSSYQLPSLDSVSSFIQANKHLPDMPSAATVEKDGHDVGEVQKQLLKKVEEMTLYMIKQEEKIKILENEVKVLKHENKK